MKPAINNDFYDELNQSWYQADDHPIALLRAEQKVKNPWVTQAILEHFKGNTKLNILDIGCGAGFLTNYLAQTFSQVNGIDLSRNSLQVAKSKDVTGKVKYKVASAYRLPYEDESMDVVCAMDFLEHVEHPQLVLQETARVLRPKGLFLFHTFNRNFLSWLIVIKCMEWFVPNTPPNMHVLEFFITPEELEVMMREQGLMAVDWRGLRPCLDKHFAKSLFNRKVEPQFSFTISDNLTLGYMGKAVKYF